MKPSELDKANGDYEEWKPEVGQECEFFLHDTIGWVEAKVVGKDGPAFVVAIDGHGYEGSSVNHYFRPLKTQADKYRDEQIELIAEALRPNAMFVGQASQIYDKGVRVLADNEFIGIELDDVQISNIVYPEVRKRDIDWDDKYKVIEIAKAVQNAIKGEA